MAAEYPTRKLVSLDSASLMAKARKRTGLDDFGDERFLEENPKGKHGAIDYRLEDLGINPEERRQALAFYRERFGVAED